jgi:hypothetical protein
MNRIWSRRRLRLVIAGAATLMTAAALASAALAGLGALDFGPAAASQYPSKKVAVCHRTHSQKHPWVKISISVHALKAHLRHGDFVVDASHPCPPTGVTAAKTKHNGKPSGKGKGKSGKNSAAAKKQNHSSNAGGKGKSGKNNAAAHKTQNHSNHAGGNGKGKGKSGKNNAAAHKTQNHSNHAGGNGKGKGKSGNNAATKGNQNHSNNAGGQGHGKK